MNLQTLEIKVTTGDQSPPPVGPEPPRKDVGFVKAAVEEAPAETPENPEPPNLPGYEGSVFQCARCGHDHRPIRFFPLVNPADDWDHFAMCPITGQPILRATVAEPEAMSPEEARDAAHICSVCAPTKDPATFQHPVEKCPRCGKDHGDMWFRACANKREWYTFCPEKVDPIYLISAPDGDRKELR